MTPAQTFAKKMEDAAAAAPASFEIGGRPYATVDSQGGLTVTQGVSLTASQAKDLRAWIKTTFMDGGQ
jgi:hypothetical protein